MPLFRHVHDGSKSWYLPLSITSEHGTRFDMFFIATMQKKNMFLQNKNNYFCWTFTFSVVKIQNIDKTPYFYQKWQKWQNNLNVLNFLDKFAFNHFFHISTHLNWTKSFDCKKWIFILQLNCFWSTVLSFFDSKLRLKTQILSQYSAIRRAHTTNSCSHSNTRKKGKILMPFLPPRGQFLIFFISGMS